MSNQKASPEFDTPVISKRRAMEIDREHPLRFSSGGEPETVTLPARDGCVVHINCATPAEAERTRRRYEERAVETANW